MIQPAHRHHEELALLPQIIALGAIIGSCASYAWHEYIKRDKSHEDQDAKDQEANRQETRTR